MALTPRQARFVDEYLIDLNATQAAVRAGYSAKTAQEQSSRLLSNVIVGAEVQRRMVERSSRTQITADRVLEELGRIGFANMLDYTTPRGDDLVHDFSALTREQASAIQELTVESYTDGRGVDARPVKRVRMKLGDKRAALVDIGRHLGMFVEKHEHTGKDGGPIETHDLTDKLAKYPREKRDAVRAALKAALGGCDEQR